LADIQLWDWLGEPLAVDVANTVRRHGMTYVDLWRTGDDVVRWARLQNGRVPVPDRQLIEARLDELRSARDDVFALLLATTSGVRLPEHLTARINERARTFVVVRQLTDTAGHVVVHAVDPADPIDELIGGCNAAAIDLVGGAGHADLGFCDAPSCGQFFMRERPNKRWCGPACGTRARVARHARRVMAGTVT
jgi:predicted RNA-binding Zn ribbon-like protein